MMYEIKEMYLFQIGERNREIQVIEDRVNKFVKQIEILELTKKLRYYEIDILNDQQKEYEENYT